ncbi:hypothetical protein AB0D97_33850 [Streptomyces roseus]|uniref:hypothetical protein n=1 Tax=Streptomyces roseus TaxID=66430 RepID=UPI0033E5C079
MRTQQELDQALNNPDLAAVYLEGRNLCVGRPPAAAECQIVAKADIEVRAAATVHVYDNVTVYAHRGAVVYADGDAHVLAMGGSEVTARGKARIVAHGDSAVRASGHAQVHARGSSKVWATDNAHVVADARATVTSLADTVRIWVTGTVTTTGAFPETVLATPSGLLPHMNDFDWSRLKTFWRSERAWMPV